MIGAARDSYGKSNGIYNNSVQIVKYGAPVGESTLAVQIVRLMYSHTPTGDVYRKSSDANLYFILRPARDKSCVQI